MSVLCGLDWAEDHHDVALVDPDGNLVSKRRISDDAAGFTQLLQLLTAAGDSAEDPIPVAIETSRGLLVACLRATGRKVYAINPKSVDRYRDRHSVARKKSDAGDALVLAHILRTDRAAHRPLPADSELAQAIAVLARAQQDAVWERTCAHNKLRSLLREYYPAILSAFAPKRGGILRPEARAILAAAPTPRTAATLTKTQLRALLVRAGRRRGIDAEAHRLLEVLAAQYLHHPPLVEDAFGVQAHALLRQLEVACTNADELAAAATAQFERHPDAEIITSLPGLGSLTGARVLAEIGDDRSRFTDARSLKAYAGSAPVTRASGKSLTVLRAEYLHHPPVVENAFGVQAVALLRQLDTASMNAEQLDAAAVAHFEKHPDAEIISSLPGLGSLTGARVLAEIGDDRSRFADARSLKAYAGSAPVTRASGKSLAVMHRRVKNQRLAAVGYSWAFSALTASPGARAHYDRRKTAGDRHTAAQRNLFNRLIGCLHHCLDTGQTYNEKIAFPPPETGTNEPAA